jgi:acyl-coenzyme A synthetase/AMP-(fatty) acid ligase
MLNLFTENYNLIPSDRIYIQNKFQIITYGEIQSSISKFQEKYHYLVGKNCALLSNSRFELAKQLPLIASVANKIFLQPQCLKDEIAKEFYSKSEIEYVINIYHDGLDVLKIACVSVLDKSDQQWLLSTSGTTGTPKLVSYKIDSLMKASKKDLVKGLGFNWGLCFDLNRFAGIQVYLQAIASGSSLTISESFEDLNVIVNVFTDKKVNCLSATPSFWRKVLMTKDSNALPLKRITLGGEIADQTILDSLRKHFIDATVIHIYASTEAGVGFTVKDCKEGFPYEYLEHSKLVSIDLKIVDGILWIRSDRGADNLLNGKLDVDGDGFINTGDIVEIINGRVLFIGRDSGTINVGGNKVIPEEIESVLNSHPEVIQSRVFGKKNPVLGMLVNAEIISKKTLTKDEMKVFKGELIAFCKITLAPFKVPAMMKFVDSIAFNESGKIVRI